MAETMNYSDSRNTKENKDLLKTINDSLDNDGVIDSTEAKLINEKYKNLKSTTLAISKDELGNLAKGLGLEESSSLFKTINKLKEIANPLTSIDSTIPDKKEGKNNLETNEKFKLGKDYLKKLIASEGGILTSEFIDGEASMLMYGREKGQVSIEEFDELVKKLDELIKSDLSDYEKNKKISVQILMSYPPKINIQVSGKAFRINMFLTNKLFEIPSEIETQRRNNIKQTILEGFKEKGIDFDLFGGISGIDFDGDDKEPYLEMVNNFVDKLNKMEKKNGVFLKNSVLKNLIQTKIFDRLKMAERDNDFLDSLDGFVDNNEVEFIKRLFAGETYFLLQNPDNFQTEEDIFRGNRGLTEGRGGNATGLRKDPSDNRRNILSNGGGTNSGFSGGGNGNGENDPRRRIKKLDKGQEEKMRKLKLGFDQKEYETNEKLIEKYSKEFNKPIDSIKEAISSIFKKEQLDGDGYIKKDDMIKLLKKYFN